MKPVSYIFLLTIIGITTTTALPTTTTTVKTSPSPNPPTTRQPEATPPATAKSSKTSPAILDMSKAPQCGVEVLKESQSKCGKSFTFKCWCNTLPIRKFYANEIVDRCTITHDREFWQMYFNTKCRKEVVGFRDIRWKGASTPLVG